MKSFPSLLESGARRTTLFDGKNRAPVREGVITYVPLFIPEVSNRNCPWLSVTAVRDAFPLRATVTPARSIPFASVTIPEILHPAMNRRARMTTALTFRVMGYLPEERNL